MSAVFFQNLERRGRNSQYIGAPIVSVQPSADNALLCERRQAPSNRRRRANIKQEQLLRCAASLLLLGEANFYDDIEFDVRLNER